MFKRILLKFIFLLFLNFLAVLLILSLLSYFGYFDLSFVKKYKYLIGLNESSREIIDREEDPESNLVIRDIQNAKESLEIREALLNAREKALDEVEKSYKLLLNDLKIKKEELNNREKILFQNEQDKKNKEKNVENIADKISNMEPEKSVKILDGLNSLLVIDVFRYMDEQAEEEGKMSIVPYLISLMDPKKVQEIIQLKTSDYENFKDSFLKDSQSQK